MRLRWRRVRALGRPNGHALPPDTATAMDAAPATRSSTRQRTIARSPRRAGGLVGLGIADVEVHLHHDGEGEAAFRDVVAAASFTPCAIATGCSETRRRPAFGFIHGNWALDNSHPSGRFCGLDNELTVLREMGCYADFTLAVGAVTVPDANGQLDLLGPDDPGAAKSHDSGERVTAGRRAAMTPADGPGTAGGTATPAQTLAALGGGG